MDFDLSDDQLALAQAVRDVAERECTTALVRSVVDGTDDADALWRTYVALDWPSLTIPEADGGMGYTAVELALVLDELGRVADPTPFLATASQYAPLVQEAFADRDAVRGELLGAAAAGGTGAAALAAGTVTAAPADGGAWTLRGTARFVVDGDRAEQIAVVAATPDGVGVFVVPAADVAATRLTTFDGSFHVADVGVDGTVVAADRAAVGPHVGDAVDRATDVALVGIAAATVGASQRIFDLGLDHLRERKQFGVPIGSFQALKHMAVDVYIAIERARVLCQFAGLLIAEDDPRRSTTASMAKAAAGDAQRIAVQHGIQFFGGLGYTWENDLQLFVRRAKVGEVLLGSASHHRARVARAALSLEARAVAS